MPPTTVPLSPAARRLVDELLDEVADTSNRRFIDELLQTSLAMAKDDADTLDLKIASAALKEMREAFRTFAPYRHIPKVTIFGSARTQPDDPLYAQARAVAKALADKGWMVVTGAGPGIMAAGMEGAGREHSFGVNIRLPMEQGANPIIAHDDKLVSMKYFFTRKLMLIKESKAFVCLPGGFGTLDETFELITLTQTGKGVPVPIVFLDTPGELYWDRVVRLIRDELLPRRLIEASDLELFTATDDITTAVDEIDRFYSNYDSLRFVGDVLVLRMKTAPSAAKLAELNVRFAALCDSGSITVTKPLREEVTDDDLLELARIKMNFAKRHFGELRALIDALNEV